MNALVEGGAFETEAERYDALISREDFTENLRSWLQENLPSGELDICDLGTGTGRLAGILAERAGSMYALDRSRPMLTTARARLENRFRGRQLLICAADHRRLPLPSGSCDLLTCGWSVSYLAVWHPATWRAELDSWLAETLRVLRPAGTIIVVESLGTGTETPTRLEHLEGVYTWLDEQGFASKWLRTDYQFRSVHEAADLIGHFFGQPLKERVRREGLRVVPECSGVWWRSAG